MTSFRIDDNFKNFDKVLRSLPGILDRLVIEDALHAAAKEGARSVRQQAPKGRKGVLRRRIRARKGLRSYSPSALIVSGAPHSHLIEFGTEDRYHRSGKFVGKGPKIPFFQRGIENGAERMIRAFSRGFRRSFVKVIREIRGGRPSSRVVRALLR